MNDIYKAFSKNNARIIRALAMSDGIHLRELAEKTKMSPASIHGAMQLFRELGFVREKKEKNRVVFSLNTENTFLAKARALMNIGEISRLASFRELTTCGTVGVYGSFAAGKDTKLSDIDIWIYPKRKADLIEIRGAARKVGAYFGMEAKIVTLSDEKIRAMKEKDPEFYYMLKLTSVVFGEDVFG